MMISMFSSSTAIRWAVSGRGSTLVEAAARPEPYQRHDIAFRQQVALLGFENQVGTDLRHLLDDRGELVYKN